MGGKIKKGSGKNRGYIGYHTTWDGIKVFLRSKAEFIYARVLDHEKIPYKLECVIYKIDGKNYKPDFFIFDSNYERILKITEIKGLDDKKTALDYISKFKEYFTSIGIEYDAIWKYQAIVTKYNLKPEIDEWVERSIQAYDFISDSRGENNPMYGMKHSTYTKNLISQKCKERNTDPEYRQRNSDSIRAFFNSDAGIIQKTHISERQKLLHSIKNPIIEKQCMHCGNVFNQKLKGNGFCNFKCLRTWKYKNIPDYGKHKHAQGDSYKKQIITYSKKIIDYYSIDLCTYLENLDMYTRNAKVDNIIPKYKGITIHTLKRYNLENIKQWQN